MKHLYRKNYKTLLREIRRTQVNGELYLVYELNKSVFLKFQFCPHFSNRFNAITFKISTAFVCLLGFRNWQANAKVKMKIQRCRLIETTLKKNNLEGLPLPDFKKVQYSWCGCKTILNRSIEQNRETEVDPCTYG